MLGGGGLDWQHTTPMNTQNIKNCFVCIKRNVTTVELNKIAKGNLSTVNYRRLF